MRPHVALAARCCSEAIDDDRGLWCWCAVDSCIVDCFLAPGDEKKKGNYRIIGFGDGNMTSLGMEKYWDRGPGGGKLAIGDRETSNRWEIL